MEKDAKIYIAGHRGMVGSAIWRNLENMGYNRLTGRTFEELDLRDQQAVAHFFEEERPDYVFLAAAKVGGIIANNTYRGEFIYDNLMIQNNIIHQAYIHRVKKLLFLGSTCIYPKECPQPMKEEYLLTGPLESTNEPYAIAKIAGIKLCENYNRQYGTHYISVMPTNLYGPNDNFDLEKSHVLPALLRKIHLGRMLEEENWAGIIADLKMEEFTSPGFKPGVNEVESVVKHLRKFGIYHPSQSSSSVDGRPPSAVVTIEVWGTGTPMREFMWSEDMADACVFLMTADGGQQTADRGFINIGTGKEISIRDLAYLIKEIVGFKGNIVFNPDKPDGTMRKVTDVSRLHSLGWHHTVELEEGIRRVYEWYLTQ